MKTVNKKLVLKKEVISALNTKQMEIIKGGDDQSEIQNPYDSVGYICGDSAGCQTNALYFTCACDYAG